MFWKLAEGEGHVERQCHDVHHHITFCSRTFHQGKQIPVCCDDPGVEFYSVQAEV